MNQAEMSKAIEILQTEVAQLKAQIVTLSAPRDRGPKSSGEMTEEHAFRVKFGDMKTVAHKAAAEALGLSYGQIFSCRGGYTFKQVKEDWKKPAEKPAETQPETPVQETPAK
jgi:hypothetical protein